MRCQTPFIFSTQLPWATKRQACRLVLAALYPFDIHCYRQPMVRGRGPEIVQESRPPRILASPRPRAWASSLPAWTLRCASYTKHFASLALPVSLVGLIGLEPTPRGSEHRVSPCPTLKLKPQCLDQGLIKACQVSIKPHQGQFLLCVDPFYHSKLRLGV